MARIIEYTLVTEPSEDDVFIIDGPQGTRTIKISDAIKVDTLDPATTSKLGCIIVGDDLQITEEGILSVQKATSVEADNTRPITSAAVYTEVGNINALLATI